MAAGLDTDTLVLLAEGIFAYIDELSAESADGFAQEQAARAGEADRLRADLIELLLRTPPAPPDAARAGRAGRRLGAAARAGGARVARGGGAAPGLPPAAGLHRRERRGSLVRGRPRPRRARAPRRDRARDGGHGRGPGLGRRPGGGRALPPPRPRGAGARARRGADALVAAAEHRLELLLRSDAGLVGELAAERLAPLDAETDLSRARLAETLHAWLRHQGNATAAADDLDVHAQTVRYRLGRLRELFGDTLDDPDARYELETVLRARAVWSS